MDNQLQLEPISITKVHGVYEIHHCGFIITATFDPLELIYKSGKTIKDKDDGFEYQKNDNYIMTCEISNGLLLHIIPNVGNEYFALLTLKDQTLHVETFDFFSTFCHEFDVEVEYRNYTTKSAATR